MANVKISELPAASAAVAANEFEINEAGTSKKVTGTQVAAFVEGVVSSAPSFTGQVSLADGSAAAPSLSNTGDLNTGLLFPAADTVGVSVGGTQRLTVGTTGVTVNGDIATTTSGSQNFVAGVDAGSSIASGGNQNVLLGDGAGATVSTGDGNIAIGFEAGNDISTGGYNLLIGWKAGDKIDTASSNVAIGDGSLSTDTKGAKSVALGSNTLNTQNFTTATDTYNVAIGYNAGQKLTVGVQNTLIGGSAGDAMTDADGNIAIGFEAGNDITTGSYNTVVGWKAGDKINTASSNTGIGDGAIGAETKGAKSVAVGSNALNQQNFTTAVDAYNVAVGYNAGQGITTGVNNTLIGGLAGDALTGDSGYSGGANNVAVGRAALGADTLGSSSVAIGFETLLAQNFTTTTESVNTAVGHRAGLAVTIGVENTLIGGYAGDALTDAGYNVAIGARALGADTLGSRSVAIGQGALSTQNFTTATNSNNVAVGYDAGLAITTGTSNTFVGSSTGDGTNDGNNNTAIGSLALSANCGDSNTAVGLEALKVCTGSNNTAMGKNAGNAVTSGNNNMLLGLDAGLTGSPGGAITTDNNFMVLGDENIATIRTAVAVTATSDQRDKTDFTALDVGLDFVKALAPVTYKWDKRSKYIDKTDVTTYNQDGSVDHEGWDITTDLNVITHDGTHKEDWLDIGFKAQEVEALEQAAGYNKNNKTNLVSSITPDGKSYGLTYEKFIPILVKAMQEQNALIEALTVRVTELEG